MRESDFQAKLIKKLNIIFPGCLVLKNDSGYIQGIPDLTVLWHDHWAFLECKDSADAARQPNQEYYIQIADEVSFGRFIFPENEEDVLRELQQAFGV